ncbi:MAG: hypothetical protein G3M70_16575 [Candidatus Nitronauta litoralis]|uniref:Uncharacterized protein n=1 Tax=Candidatus Nitronauta litoralis TaxID=2705533 RepID=A0A7T0BYQ7_9BACT|nr:MAG: hypothetical protein G3M70_16575 [Candidatus Nitronauta litoralis]
MNLEINEISGVKVINIIEENAQAIETMVNKAIEEIKVQNKILVDVQTTEDNIFLIFGNKRA